MKYKPFRGYKASIASLFILCWRVTMSQSLPPSVMAVAPPDIQIWVGKKLPTFSLQDSTGKMYTNESIHGKLTVINLWSVTCHPCIDEMPLLNKLVEKYADQTITFLAPAPESLDKINRILAHQRFTYTILPQAQALFKSFNLAGYPYHILVDRNGYIRSIWTGTINAKTGQKIAETELPAAIDRALN